LWNKQLCPPSNYVVIDNDSDGIEPSLPSNAKWFPLYRNENIGKAMNEGIDMVTTDAFTEAEVNIIPDNKTGYLLTQRSQPNVLCVGIRILFNDIENIPVYECDPPHIQELKTPWCNNPDFCMRFKSNFLYYNEAYKGWGGTDNDYLARYLNTGGKIYHCSDIAVYHWNHARLGTFYTKQSHEDNLKFLQNNFAQYHKYKTTILNKNNGIRCL
jgi:hypothetical protein